MSKKGRKRSNTIGKQVVKAHRVKRPPQNPLHNPKDKPIFTTERYGVPCWYPYVVESIVGGEGMVTLIANVAVNRKETT